MQDSHRRLGVKALVMAATVMTGLSGPVLAAPYMMDDAFRASVEGIQSSLQQGDTNGAQSRAQALVSAADQPFEKYTAGQLMLQAAVARADYRSQRLALTTILDSGQATAAEAPRLRAIAGTLSAMLGDRKDAIAQIDYANGQGYATTESQIALADAKFLRNDANGGTTALDEAFALQAKAGKPVAASWYDRSISLAYRAKRFDLVARWTQAKLAAYPSAPNWRSGIINYVAGAGTAPDQSVDLYRLMAATDALASERDWLAYSSVALQKGSAAEGKAALDTGLKAGSLDSIDAALQKELIALRPKAAKALAEIPALTAKAKTTTTGTAALAAADAQFAAASYPAAVELYRAALAKGGIDADRATTRLGVALARSGDLEGGKAMLATVKDGAWAPVAGFWTVWVDRKLVRNPA
ncbi:hypothetical protein LWE61_15510 [Sphingobium sufflavum]|uniref:hypothetical protein n=1 Tax=Sphingobium sufflavum TaxID=1129547 RepID=UPI001F432A4E|nr:hypothetical protein [Sphingobium sufflavum]MCE7797956.1 hypothetical protein [Sphingobium sufflavum]